MTRYQCLTSVNGLRKINAGEFEGHCCPNAKQTIGAHRRARSRLARSSGDGWQSRCLWPRGPAKGGRAQNGEDLRAQGRNRRAGTGGQIQDREGFALSALRARRGARRHQRAIRAQPAHGRAQAMGAQGRQGRGHQPRGLAHVERLLRLRDRAGQGARAAAPSVRGDDPGARRPRLDHGVEQCRRRRELRVEGRRDVRDPAQLLVPALQRPGPGAGALRRRYQRALRHQPLRRSRFRVRSPARLQEPLLRRGGLFQRQGRADGLPAADQFRAGRGQPAADRRQGARRRRRPHPLQHGARLDRQPHLAVSRRHLQEGARARAGRPRHRALGRRLFADVAGGRGAAPLRLAGRHAHRAAQRLVPPAFQCRADAGALSRLQALLAAQCSGGADLLDLAAAGRNADRLRRRASAGSPPVRRGARPARHGAAHGRGVRGGASEPAAQGGVNAQPRRWRPAMAKKATRPPRLPYLLRVMHARPRLTSAAVFGIAVAVLLPSHWWATTRSLVGWSAGVALYLLLVYILIARCNTEQIRDHAAREDEGRVGILMLTVFAALASLGAIVVELHGAGDHVRGGFELALATTTIVLSWVLIHTIFALHYAHDYYGEYGAKQSGLNFPGDEPPDYWDFVYFSFVIGMTSQVSDVAVASRAIRRTVIAHRVVSFFFNVALLALMVNIAASAI